MNLKSSTMTVILPTRPQGAASKVAYVPAQLGRSCSSNLRPTISRLYGRAISRRRWPISIGRPEDLAERYLGATKNECQSGVEVCADARIFVLSELEKATARELAIHEAFIDALHSKSSLGKLHCESQLLALKRH